MYWIIKIEAGIRINLIFQYPQFKQKLILLVQNVILALLFGKDNPNSPSGLDFHLRVSNQVTWRGALTPPPPQYQMVDIGMAIKSLQSRGEQVICNYVLCTCHLQQVFLHWIQPNECKLFHSLKYESNQILQQLNYQPNITVIFLPHLKVS